MCVLIRRAGDSDVARLTGELEGTLMQYNRLLVFGLLGLALTLGACVKRNVETLSHPPLSVTFLPQKGDLVSKYGTPVNFKEITDIAAGYDYILIGEGHRNPVDHKVQQGRAAGAVPQRRWPLPGP